MYRHNTVLTHSMSPTEQQAINKLHFQLLDWFKLIQFHSIIEFRGYFINSHQNMCMGEINMPREEHVECYSNHMK